jgi:hypothetical protein
MPSETFEDIEVHLLAACVGTAGRSRLTSGHDMASARSGMTRASRSRGDAALRPAEGGLAAPEWSDVSGRRSSGKIQLDATLIPNVAYFHFLRS